MCDIKHDSATNSDGEAVSIITVSPPSLLTSGTSLVFWLGNVAVVQRAGQQEYSPTCGVNNGDLSG